MNNDQPQPPTVAARRLANAWSALMVLLILWVLFGSSATLGLGALGWSIGAVLLARRTHAAVGDARWLSTVRRIGIGIPLLFIAQSLLVATPFDLLIWLPVLVSVPPRTTVRALRVLRSGPGSQPARPSRWARLRTVSLALLVGVATCAPTGAMRILELSTGEDEPPTPGVAGCYSTWMSGRMPSIVLGGGAFGMIPARLQLDSARGPLIQSVDTTRESSMARSSQFARERGRQLIRPGWWRGGATWQARSSRTVSLTWSNGYWGASATLLRFGGNLVGQVEGFNDIPTLLPSALIWLHETDCRQVPMDTTRQSARSAIVGST